MIELFAVIELVVELVAELFVVIEIVAELIAVIELTIDEVIVVELEPNEVLVEVFFELDMEVVEIDLFALTEVPVEVVEQVAVVVNDAPTLGVALALYPVKPNFDEMNSIVVVVVVVVVVFLFGNYYETPKVAASY